MTVASTSKEQRDEHIRQYATLLAEKEAREVSTQSASKPKINGRPKAVASKVADQTGISKDTVRRALNPERVQAERSRAEICALEKTPPKRGRWS